MFNKFVLVLSLLISTQLFALELDCGKSKVTLNETTLRMTVSYVKDGQVIFNEGYARRYSQRDMAGTQGVDKFIFSNTSVLVRTWTEVNGEDFSYSLNTNKCSPSFGPY